MLFPTTQTSICNWHNYLETRQFSCLPPSPPELPGSHWPPTCELFHTFLLHQLATILQPSLRPRFFFFVGKVLISDVMRFLIYRDGLPWPCFFFLPSISLAVILSGSADSYARLFLSKVFIKFVYRYPKWAHSYENSLSLELKTKQSNGLLLYTDDGGVAGNFYAISISDGRIQLDFR